MESFERDRGETVFWGRIYRQNGGQRRRHGTWWRGRRARGIRRAVGAIILEHCDVVVSADTTIVKGKNAIVASIRCSGHYGPMNKWELPLVEDE